MKVLEKVCEKFVNFVPDFEYEPCFITGELNCLCVLHSHIRPRLYDPPTPSLSLPLPLRVYSPDTCLGVQFQSHKLPFGLSATLFVHSRVNNRFKSIIECLNLRFHAFISYFGFVLCLEDLFCSSKHSSATQINASDIRVEGDITLG